ncbi:MAG: M23 family metallopeptidase [Fibrobacterota bacterium]
MSGWFVLFFAVGVASCCDWLLPVDVPDRKDTAAIRITPIGAFGNPRKARLGVPAHYHSGYDIARVGSVDADAPVFAASCGKVVSMREDGPFAQIILYHPDDHVWTVYEHVSGILVHVGQDVTEKTPLARIMNRKELNRYGWHFNHLHFEVLRCEPRRMQSSAGLSERFYRTYGTECSTLMKLHEKYLDPLSFLKMQWNGGT